MSVGGVSATVPTGAGAPVIVTSPGKPDATTRINMQPLALAFFTFGLTNPQLSSGKVTTQPAPLSLLPTATIGGVAATVVYAGSVQSLSDVYQFNVTVPATLASGDWPVVVTVNGTTSYPGLITVQN